MPSAEFRRKARDSLSKALTASNPEDKELLLQLSEEWLELAREAESETEPAGGAVVPSGLAPRILHGRDN